MRYEIRPVGAWTDPVTEDRRPPTAFRANWTDTLELLGKEAEYLGADMVVLQVDVTEGEIRRDGMLRANARVGFPGVRVSFDSIYGPLTYATDTFDGWQANIRAIALALTALRAVDRYGVTKRGEQYRGWTAIEPPADTAAMTVEQAARLLAHNAGPGFTPESVIASPEIRARAYRAAARRHHPDAGGDSATFRQVTEARDLLDRGGA